MARSVVEVVTCDVCGMEPAGPYGISAPSGDVADVDLCADHASPLEALFEVGRVKRKRGRRPASAPAATRRRPRRRRTAKPAAANSDIREWALNNGYDVSQRGRIPAQVVDAYAEAQR